MNLKEYISQEHGGNKLNAAKSLKISRRMIYLYLQGKSFPVKQKTLKSFAQAGIEVPKI